MAKTRTLNIPAPNIGRINVRIRGLTPLMQNRWRPGQIEEIEAKQGKKAGGKKEARDPEAEVREILSEATFSSNGKVVYGHPKEAFVEAVASAGYRVGQFKSLKEVRAVFKVATPHDLVPIESPAPETDRRMGRIKGTFTVVYRPKYWPWEMTLPIEFDRGVLTEEQVIRLIQDAGRCIGVGSYRIENKGAFGSFEVIGAELQEDAP